MIPFLVATCEGHKHFVLCCAFSTDSRILASGGADDSIILWETSTGKRIRELIGHSDYVQTVMFCPSQDDLLASGGRDGKILLWSVSEGRQITGVELRGHDAAVRSVCFDAAGELLASCSGAQTSSEKQDNSIRVWSLSSGAELLLVRAHSATVSAVAWHPSKSILATASRDRTVGFHDISSIAQPASRLLRGHTDYVNAVAWSPCGMALASGSSDRTVRVWDRESGSILQVPAPPA
jgi:predicted NACHT family NTPase